MNSIPSVDALAKALVTKLDGNKDNQVSTEEFTTFLTKLLSGVQNATAPTPAAGAAATSASAVRFEGFDFAKAGDPATSAKYAFASIAQRVGTMPANAPDAERWFNTSIKGEMEKLGHKIDWVKGERFQFSNWQGTFVVDYLRGASASNPALAWQVE